MDMPFRLEDRGVIALSGPEARDFLQGLVTNDVRRVTPASHRYAALLTPQGKILFDFHIGEQDGALLLDCPLSARDALTKRLSLYRLRAKVEIRPRDDLAVLWEPGETAPQGFVRDTRHPDLGWRAMAADAAGAAPGAAAYLALRLDCGIPEGSDFGQDRIFALDADLDELGGIAFDKGCYVGQELTARMKHRGTARKRLLPAVALSGTLPPPETPIRAGTHDIGILHACLGARGFALVRLDRLAEAGGAYLHAGDVAVALRKPEWLFP